MNLNRAWIWFCHLFREHPSGTYAILTIVIGIPFLTWALHKIRAMSVEKVRLAHDILGVSALVIAVATSYGILANPAVGLTGIWSLLVPSIQFLAAVLIKLLIVFYSTAILSGLLQPGRILKFGAKVPGFEFNNELAQIDEAVGKLGETERNYDLIANLNEMILDYVASPFEGSILNSTDPAEEIRQQTRQVLLTAYRNHPGVSIHVVPATEEGLSSLGDRLGTVVRRLFNRNVDISTVDGDSIGVGIHHGTEGFVGTIIAIDATTEGNGVTAAEINAASILYVSVASTIGAALINEI